MSADMPFDPAICRLEELTQYIRDTHHAYLRAELPAIWDLLRKAIGTSPATATDLRQITRLFGQFRSTLENHLQKEEDVLFPFIERLERTVRAGAPAPRHAFGPLAGPIEILEAEHAFGDRLLDAMRPLWQRWAPSNEAPRGQPLLYDRLTELEADMQRHVHVEDAILFPRTIGLEGGPCLSAAGAR
jgi:regulator of cell morphogenesis and NO signaling